MKLLLTLQTMSVIFALHLHALPSGFECVQGSAHLQNDGNGSATVTNSAHAIIHWNDFSIATQESLHFAQANAASAVLNRVTGTQVSSLLGTLTSNGKVYLINPSGVLIGPDALIQTAGFLASTANLSDAEFLNASSLTLFDPSDAKIVNKGQISCPEGDIYLIAKEVVNEGSCSADFIGVGSSLEVIIQPQGTQRLYIRPDMTEQGSIINEGTLQALAIEMKSSSPYEKAIQQKGTVQALSTQAQKGRVFLVAQQGGNIVDGHIAAEAGEIQILGQDVALLENARVDASGPNGGTIYLGGGKGGKDSSLLNARTTTALSGAQLIAEGITGNGGQVVVWGTEKADFHGHISVQGHQDGGFVEISARDQVIPDDLPNTRGLFGKNGHFLIDPAGPIHITHSGVLSPFTDAWISSQLAIGSLTINTATDAPAAGAQTLTVDPDVGIAWSNNNNFSLIAGLGATFNGTAGQPITIQCTGAGNTGSFSISGGVVPAAAAYTGVYMDYTQISCTEGSISISGQGGSVAGGSFQNMGVILHDGCSLTTSSSTPGNGAITLTGIGGTANGTDGADGCDIQTSTIQTNAGNINYTGSLSITGSLPITEAIFISGSTIQSTGVGNVTLTANVLGSAKATLALSIESSLGSNTLKVKDGNLSITVNAGTADTALHIGDAAATVQSTGSGNIIISASTTAPSTAANCNAVFFNNTISSTGTGSIQITGNSGAAAQVGGIATRILGTVSSVSGNITINGTASGTSSGNQGIVLATGALIKNTGAGQISMTGTGSANGTAGTNQGILLNTNSKVTSNTGPIQLIGTGGTGSSNNQGILATGAGTQISSTSGSISLNGTGKGTGSSNDGISILAGAQVSTAGAGTVDLTGAAPATGSGNSAILISGTSSLISSASGNINITATGAGSGASNPGLSVLSGGAITTTAGTVQTAAPHATGSTTGTSSCYGILVDGANSTISSTTGGINLQGIGHGSGTTNQGIRISNAASIKTTSAAPITLTGTGSASGSSSNEGIFITGSSTMVSSTNGQIQLTATAGGGTTNGITVDSNATVVSNTSGKIFANSANRLVVQNNSSIQTLGAGGPNLNDISITTGGLSILGGASGKGLISTVNGNIQLTSSTANLILTGSSSVNSFAQMTVGNSANTVTINSIGINMTAGSASGAFAEISSVGGLISIDGAGSISLTGGSNTNTYAQIITKTNAIVGNAIQIGGSIHPTSITLQGGSSASTSRAVIASDAGGHIRSDISGNYSITGGTSSTDSRAGFYTGLTSGSGDITLTGAGYSLTGGTSGTGYNSAEIMTPATGGSISLTSNSSAVTLLAQAATTSDARIVTLGGGNIDINSISAFSATGGSGTSSRAIVQTNTGGHIAVTGTGNYTVHGGTSATDSRAGFYTGLTSGSGDITLSGASFALAGGNSGAGYNSAEIMAPAAGGNIQLNYTTTASSLHGGGGATSDARIITMGTGTVNIAGNAIFSAIGGSGASSVAEVNAQGTLTANIGSNNYILTGGSGTSSFAQFTGTADVNMTGSNYTLTAGSSPAANGSDALIQSTGTNGSVTVTANNTGAITLTGGSTPSQNSYIQTTSGAGSNPVHVTCKTLTLNGSTSGGATNASAQVASVQGNITVNASGDIQITGGAAAGSNALIDSSTQGAISVQAANLNVLGGSGAGSSGIQTQSGDITVTCSDSCNYNAPNAGSLAVMQTFGSNLTFTSGGSISLLGNTVYTTAAPGNMLLIANVDIQLGNLIALNVLGNASSSLTLVADNAYPTPPNYGPGKIVIQPGAQLTTGGLLAPVRIYSAAYQQDSVPSGTIINGQAFTPGTICVDTQTQLWNYWYQQPLPSLSPIFAFIYKSCASFVPPVTPVTPATPASGPIANQGSLNSTINSFLKNNVDSQFINIFNLYMTNLTFCDFREQRVFSEQ